MYMCGYEGQRERGQSKPRTDLDIQWENAALGRLLLRPTETFAGDPDHCRMMDDSPNDPGVANA